MSLPEDRGEPMTLSVDIHAGDGEVFAHDYFAAAIGRPVAVQTGVGEKMGTLVGAVVSDDGSSAELTAEIPDPDPAFVQALQGDWNIDIQ